MILYTTPQRLHVLKLATSCLSPPGQNLPSAHPIAQQPGHGQFDCKPSDCKQHSHRYRTASRQGRDRPVGNSTALPSFTYLYTQSRQKKNSIQQSPAFPPHRRSCLSGDHHDIDTLPSPWSPSDLEFGPLLTHRADGGNPSQVGYCWRRCLRKDLSAHVRAHRTLISLVRVRIMLTLHRSVFSKGTFPEVRPSPSPHTGCASFPS